MRLIQYRDTKNEIQAAVIENGQLHALSEPLNIYQLASRAIAEKVTLAELVQSLKGAQLDYETLFIQKNISSPIHHKDAAHLLVSGTGLTHLGSADTRNAMHSKASGAEETLTDSMKMFRMGVENGKPASGETGVQPEWFYKGDGGIVVGPGEDIPSPDFALDGSEEPEIAGIYLIGEDRQPYRLGFALGNEFSDHQTERMNYLYLAHSKLRHCSLGPELLVGELPGDIRGTSRIIRNGNIAWEKEFLSGEDNMSHSIANLEYHHFKYNAFLRPGDIHVHFFGTATLSFGDGFKTQEGDIFEIEAPGFGKPLRNRLSTETALQPEVKAL
jgi:hypothetical protein